MKKTKKYIGLIFLYFLTVNNSHGLTITDNNILKQLLTCSDKQTIVLGSQNVCNQWVVDIVDEDAINGKGIDSMKVRCSSYSTINTSVSTIDNMGFSSVSTQTHYSYRCSNGAVIPTNNCSVMYYTTEGCGGHGNGYYDWGRDACKARYGSSAYRYCGDGWRKCRDPGRWCCRNVQRYDTSSTRIVTSYTHTLSMCNTPTIKNIAIDKIYDPNKVYK